jgi:putative ABC transport system ATP-binding protein
MDDAALTELRRTTIAHIFQGFGLLPVLTAAENVEVPLRLLSWPAADRQRRVDEVMHQVGLTGRSQHRPDQLSGGEQQRVAIARAIAARPKVLIADEPTGQLDSRTGESIMALLHDLVFEQGLTAVVATHDDKVIGAADRRIELSDGRVTVGKTGSRTTEGSQTR